MNMSARKAISPNQRACILCGGGSFDEYSPGLRRCRGCGFVSADLNLSEEEHRALYARQYFFGTEYRDYVADRQEHQRNFRLRLDVLDRFLEPSRHRHLLEIGSAFGFFLELARERFETVRGLDVSAEGTEFARARGLEVSNQDFLTAPLAVPPPDVVCLWDVLEHLREPHLYLEKIAAEIAPGGLVALTTGDIGSVNARLRGRRWRLIHPPTHLNYFSRRTIAAMLDKYGFDILYDRYCGFYRSVDGMAWGILALRAGVPSLHRLLRRMGLLQWDLYLNLFDITYVIARKRR